MRVIERYYGPVRAASELRMRVRGRPYGFPMETFEAYLEVEVEGRTYCADYFESFYGRVPEFVIMRGLEEKILKEIQRELFGRY